MAIATTSDADLLKALGNSSTQVNIKPDDIKSYLAKKGQDLEIDDSVLLQICSAINSGKNLILSGPPGTGKTTLAEAISFTAQGREPIITTATADWTTFDTIGGYMPDVNNPNKLRFEPGILLQSIIDRNWIVVDEINRSQIDKAIGQFFSVLSGNDVLLTYRNEETNNRIGIRSGNQSNSKDEFYKTDDWRMIATMNEVDKTTLFDMSDAFLRRFSLIRVGLPEQYEKLVRVWSKDLNSEIIESLATLADKSEANEVKEIGPALMIDLINYLKERKEFDEDYSMHYSEGLAMFIIPQFQGSDDEEIYNLLSVVGEVLKKSNKAVNHINRSIRTTANSLVSLELS